MTEHELDVWRIAALLLAKHGDTRALVFAERRAQDALYDDPVQHALWEEVADAIDELVRMPQPGDTVH